MSCDLSQYQELKQQLASLYKQGIPARRKIDAVLRQHETEHAQDLQRIFAIVSLHTLRELLEAIDQGRLVRRCYFRVGEDGVHQRCIVGVLFGHHKTGDLLNHPYPDLETFMAVNRITRAWDYNELSYGDLRSILEDFLKQRERSVSAAPDSKSVVAHDLAT